jgi:hypothetical protein
MMHVASVVIDFARERAWQCACSWRNGQAAVLPAGGRMNQDTRALGAPTWSHP